MHRCGQTFHLILPARKVIGEFTFGILGKVLGLLFPPVLEMGGGGIGDDDPTLDFAQLLEPELEGFLVGSLLFCKRWIVKDSLSWLAFVGDDKS